MSDGRDDGLRARQIAIVGMAGRFPGAPDVETFWRNLRQGVESISFFSEEELAAAGVDPHIRRHPGFVNAGGILEGAEDFDCAFFGINPREAELMDPQHRVFLECAWTAFESAGYDPRRFPGLVGVFAGSSLNTYLLHNLLPRRDLLEAVGFYQAGIGNDKDFLATRISYKLDLRGPSLAVQTACSTSLVAVHLACQSLLNGECDMALAGGVSVLVPQRAGYVAQEGGVVSPDGHCRAFDAAARGTVSGQGAGAVVLRRLADALEDGDPIQAVIRGSAVNNDGARKAGFTAPGAEGQAEAVAEALAMAMVEPDGIGFVEAHGTGTELGDPIEVEALSRVFQDRTGHRGFCALGSVKSNVGHLDAAAGVTGLIKAVLAVENGEIPPTLHFREPNPRIDLAASPFYVNTSLVEWPGRGAPRVAGVSSFGIGGTNAHVVIGEAPLREPSGPPRPAELLLLSARTPSALEAATDRLADHLESRRDLGGSELADIAYTLQVGRAPLRQRRAVVCRSREQAVEALRRRDPGRMMTRAVEPGERSVTFLFPGQGTQHPGMGAELYAAEPLFRELVDRGCEQLGPELELDLRELLFPPQGARAEAAARLERTAAAQPALFVIEHALARLWMQWGVKPRALIGHSLGEYVAACLAGVFSYEEGLRLVALRGRLMDAMAPGAMLGVSLPEPGLRTRLKPAGGALSLAAVNAPAACVVSGPAEEVDRLRERLAAEGVETRRLHTSHAFHSRMMDPVAERFAREVARFELRPPRIPWLSNVTGTWITAGEAMDPGYWARHLRETVRFADGVARLWEEEPERILLEVGPGRALTALSLLSRGSAASGLALPSLPAPDERRSDLDSLLAAAGRLWVEGVELDWGGFHARSRRRRVALPTYPFERQRCWIDPGERSAAAVRALSSGKDPDLARWFHLPAWRPALSPRPAGPEERRRWLVLLGGEPLGEALLARLREEGREVVAVRAGERFKRHGESELALRPAEPGDWARLVAELRGSGGPPAAVAHLWTLTQPETASGPELFDRMQDLGYLSLLALARAFADAGWDAPLRLGVISNRLLQVGGEEPVLPEKATLLGPCRVLPQERPGLSCVAVDVQLPTGGNLSTLAGRLIAEIDAASPDPVVAWRGARRWLESYEPVRLAEDLPARRPLRDRGVYLITGGMGHLGLALAGFLAQRHGARLVLVGRSLLPQSDARLLALEEAGAEVLAVQADVADAERMKDVVELALRRFGALHGVVHAAGVRSGPSVAPAVELGREASELQLRSKARGLYALERALAGVETDFRVLFSSNAALLGGLGLTAYAAANLFLDAFACSRGPGWLSIDWDPWEEEPSGAPRTGLDRYEMTVGEGLEAFRRAVELGEETRLVVATGDLPSRLDTWARRGTRPEGEPDAPRARRSLATPHALPASDAERRIAEVWEELLGIPGIGIHDNFFELGGHSLLGVQVVSRLGALFEVDLSPAVLFEAPTVAELALAVEVALIESLRALEEPAAEVAQPCTSGTT